MIRRYCVGLVLAVLLLAASGLGAAAQDEPKSKTQSAAASKAVALAAIDVTGAVSRPMSVSGAELAKYTRQSVHAKGHDGVESQYEGVPLIELLAKAGVPTGKDLRGQAMALYVVVEAADGYRAVFALAELDAAFADRVILVADRRDGRPLSAKEGPYQIIVPGEKKHVRWVRQVIRLRVAKG